MWGYTPRQLHGFLFIAARRRQAELADQLALGMMASRGDPKEVKKQLKELRK